MLVRRDRRVAGRVGAVDLLDVLVSSGGRPRPHGRENSGSSAFNSRSGRAPTPRPSWGRRRTPPCRPVRTPRHPTPGSRACSWAAAHADHERQDHEGEPAEDRLLAVLGAPATCAGPGSAGARAAERRSQTRSGGSAQGPSGTCESSWPVLSGPSPGQLDGTPATSARVRAQRARDGRWRPWRPYTRRGFESTFGANGGPDLSLVLVCAPSRRTARRLRVDLRRPVDDWRYGWKRTTQNSVPLTSL